MLLSIETVVLPVGLLGFQRIFKVPGASSTVTLSVLNTGSKVDCVRQPHTYVGGLKCNLYDPIDEHLGAMRNGTPEIYVET